MGTLSAGKRHGSDVECGRLRLHLDHHLLMAQKLDAGPSMRPSTPVTPEERRGTSGQWMEQHADLARLLRGLPLPLTLLAERTGPTTADAGSIRHAQAAIGFSALLLDTKLLLGWTPKRPVWLECEIAARETTRFPSRAYLRRSIARDRSRVWRRRGKSRSKLGGTQRLWLELMPQLQPQIPGPLGEALPGFLPPGRVTAPAVRVLFDIFVC